jgi:hypothetical protein
MATATCAGCGTSFMAVRSTAAYCSPACRQRAYRERRNPTPYRNDAPVTVSPVPGTDDTNTTVIDWDSLPPKAKDREAVLRRVIRREIEAEFEPRVQETVQKRLGVSIDRMEQMRADARRVLDSRNGFVTRAEYDLIRSCLHPDSRLSVSDNKLAKAFRVFNEAEMLFLNENDYPTTTLPSLEELRKRRRRV